MPPPPSGLTHPLLPIYTFLTQSLHQLYSRFTPTLLQVYTSPLGLTPLYSRFTHTLHLDVKGGSDGTGGGRLPAAPPLPSPRVVGGHGRSEVTRGQRSRKVRGHGGSEVTRGQRSSGVRGHRGVLEALQLPEALGVGRVN